MLNGQVAQYAIKPFGDPGPTGEGRWCEREILCTLRPPSPPNLPESELAAWKDIGALVLMTWLYMGPYIYIYIHLCFNAGYCHSFYDGIMVTSLSWVLVEEVTLDHWAGSLPNSLHVWLCKYFCQARCCLQSHGISKGTRHFSVGRFDAAW